MDLTNSPVTVTFVTVNHCELLAAERCAVLPLLWLCFPKYLLFGGLVHA